MQEMISSLSRFSSNYDSFVDTLKKFTQAVTRRWLSFIAAVASFFIFTLSMSLDSFSKALNQGALPKVYSKRLTTLSIAYILHATSSDSTQ